MTRPTAGWPPDGGQPAAARRPAWAVLGHVSAVLRRAVAEPFTPRARREFLFCLLGLPFGIPVPVAGFFVIILGLELVSRHPNPPWWAVLAGAVVAVALLLGLVTTGTTRRLGATCRGMAARLLGERVAAPPPVPARQGRLAGFGAHLRDGPGWRATAYLMAKFPVAVFASYALSFWCVGLINVSFPFWWLSFRNHPPGTQLSPVPVFTPFGWFGQGAFQVATFPGTFAALAAGVAMLLAAPWATRAVASADRWLIRGLLGPGKLALRIADLEQTRALAVDDSAARMRRLERNLHDGAQIRLATLAMSLGMAKEKLVGDADPPDLAAVRELVDAAHQGAKDALVELRDLARGIHPPVLDNGLADALATLAAGSAIPVEVTVSAPRRPSPAIESIAYFCSAELLANAVKHSAANKIKVVVAEQGGMLELTVADDGRGGAGQSQGSGLSGLVHRVSTVDGRVDIVSPPGGPTRITVALPLRA